MAEYSADNFAEQEIGVKIAFEIGIEIAIIIAIKIAMKISWDIGYKICGEIGKEILKLKNLTIILLMTELTSWQQPQEKENKQGLYLEGCQLRF